MQQPSLVITKGTPYPLISLSSGAKFLQPAALYIYIGIGPEDVSGTRVTFDFLNAGILSGANVYDICGDIAMIVSS